MTSGDTIAAPGPPRETRDALVLVVVLSVSLALGAATAYAQGVLPDELGSLANSVGTWGFVAFALALLARRLWSAALASTLSLLALVAGYYTANELRDFPASSRAVVFWLLAAVLAGPALGIAASWLRHGVDHRASLGAGLASGILIGEGIYGVTFIAETTYPPYWWAQIVCGIALLITSAFWRLRSVPSIALAIGTAAVIATAFVLLYSQDLLALL